MGFRYVAVDDAAFIRELIKNILKPIGGVCVGEAAHGEEAVVVVAKTLPDLVILDMVLPKLNGIEVARQIRETNYEVKIIACSTLDHDAIMENAMDIGCNDYIVKPFTKEGLIALVQKYFPGTEMTHE